MTLNELKEELGKLNARGDEISALAGTGIIGQMLPPQVSSELTTQVLAMKLMELFAKYIDLVPPNQEKKSETV